MKSLEVSTGPINAPPSFQAPTGNFRDSEELDDKSQFVTAQSTFTLFIFTPLVSLQ